MIHIAAATEYTLPQVRTDPVEMDTQTFKQTWGYDDGVSSDLTATYSFSHKYNKYEDGDQSKSARDLGFGLIDSATDTEVPGLNPLMHFMIAYSPAPLSFNLVMILFWCIQT